MHLRRTVTLLSAVLLSTAGVSASATARSAPGCVGQSRIAVPGAAFQTTSCLPDMTTAATAGTAYTDSADWASLSAKGTRNPTGVPGIQIDGYFPDSSHLNKTHGWNHDSQFVIRLPEHWNGGWLYHEAALTQKVYRAEVDPFYDPKCPGASAGSALAEILAPCASDASYHYATRPGSVHRAVERISLTGRIGKPVITLHGSLDALLPIATDSDAYARMISDSHRGRLHRYYTIAGGTRVDGLYDTYPDRLRPILPCYRSAFHALTDWVEHWAAPPASGTVTRPTSGDLVNFCVLN
ncbi:3-hydroxybutyrate oligomer hydrolase family protein [Streptomyces sp. NPDC059837]|uniref:3-hydroxybutyrate oligomer hydrolase family protein n=1 Tax=Streptomyces sp. NPDC059837 TaxID=3346968 RepID=UPI0036626E7C